MANGPKDYRDPKVTTTGTDMRSSGMKWLWWILAAIVILILLAWVLGWFDGTDVIGTVPVTPENTTVVPVDE